MQFNSLSGSNVNDYVNAGKSTADAAVKAFAIQRKTGPDYGEIAKTAMATRSAERVAAMQAESKVTQAGIKAVANTAETAIRTEGDLRVNKSKIKSKMAGGIAAIARGVC